MTFTNITVPRRRVNGGGRTISDFGFSAAGIRLRLRLRRDRRAAPPTLRDGLVGHASRVPCAAEVPKTLNVQRSNVRTFSCRTPLRSGACLKMCRGRTGRRGQTPQVNPLGQLDADGQSLPELEDPLAKVDIIRSTFVVSHLGQWTVDLSAPTGWRSENRSPHNVHLYS